MWQKIKKKWQKINVIKDKMYHKMKCDKILSVTTYEIRSKLIETLNIIWQKMYVTKMKFYKKLNMATTWNVVKHRIWRKNKKKTCDKT